MTFGTEARPAKVDLADRDRRIIEMMRLKRPVRTIAQLVGLERDYCRKICVRLATKHGFEYKPANTCRRSEMKIIGLTDDSRRFRSFLGDKLYQLGDDNRRIAKLLGMTLRCQKYARQRPFTHDWTVAQIERMAVALDTDFLTLMRSAMNA